MGNFLSYSIESGLVMLAMFLAFRLALAAEKQHSYNRGVILMIYAISFLALPAMHIVKDAFHRSAPAAMPDIAMMISTVGVNEYHAPVWGTALIWIYVAGMTVVTLRTVATWIRIIRVIARGEKIRKDGYTLVLTDDEGLSPFSWIRYVVMSRADYAQCGDTITAHELKHIRLGHWADLLVAQAAVIVNWFNPAAWLLREELMLIHEYQADMAVLDSGHNAREYQMLLIKKAVGARFPSLANSLNHSKLKKRITMMYQEKSGKARRLRALALVPAVAVALASTSIPQVQAAMSTIANSATSVSKVTENPANGQTSQQIAVSDTVSRTTPVQGTFTPAAEPEPIKVVSYGTIKKEQMGSPTDPNSMTTAPAREGKKAGNITLKLDSDTLGARQGSSPEHPAIFVDGKEIPYEEINNIDPATIESISVFKDENAGKIVITLKK